MSMVLNSWDPLFLTDLYSYLKSQSGLSCIQSLLKQLYVGAFLLKQSTGRNPELISQKKSIKYVDYGFTYTSALTLNAKFRGVFRTQSNIYDGAFL